MSSIEAKLRRLVAEYERGFIKAEALAQAVVRIFKGKEPLLRPTSKKWMLTPGWVDRHNELTERIKQAQERFRSWRRQVGTAEAFGGMSRSLSRLRSKGYSADETLMLLTFLREFDNIAWKHGTGPAPFLQKRPTLPISYRIVAAKTSQFPSESSYNEYIYALAGRMEHMVDILESFLV